MGEMCDSRPSTTEKVGKQRRITIGKPFCEKHGIEPGDHVETRPVEYPEPDDVSEEKIEEFKDKAEELFKP